MLWDTGFELERASLQQFRTKAPDFPLPEDARDINVKMENVPDGHVAFVSYISATPDGNAAMCGDLCIDANRVDVGAMPEQWPSAEELRAPNWMTVQAPGTSEGWARVEVEPYTVEMNGAAVPCGYKNARGRGFFVEREAQRTTIVDFAIQWYRTGCGG